jgi:hypothetical protein
MNTAIITSADPNQPLKTFANCCRRFARPTASANHEVFLTARIGAFIPAAPLPKQRALSAIDGPLPGAGRFTPDENAL